MTVAKAEINDATQSVDVNDSKLNHLVAVQLQKTKMCAMHQRGTCRDPNCRFAHSPDELRAAPNLTKTAICRMFTRGQCNNNGCKFAHGEQELRVTPTVYKTQLCNFHMRGHCKKGSRCRHAHGDDELRSFLSQASTSSPPPSASPALSEEEDKTGFYEEVGAPYESHDFQALISPLAGHWPSMGPFPEWWAANPQSPSNMRLSPTDSQFTEWWANTPPPTNMYSPSNSQGTPEKVVPPLPGAPKSSAGNSDIAEPMKIALPSSSTPGLPAASPLHAQEDVSMIAARAQQHAAQMAWAAQANMDYELAAAQLKVQELQVKRQMYTAVRFAATAPPNVVTGPQEGHFESIMNTLQQMPSRPTTPAGSAPPGLECIADTQQRGTAWVI